MMAIGRVVVDSDEEEDGASSCVDSPERIMVIEKPNGSEGNNTASLQTSSTGLSSIDPVLFKAVYKQHLGMTPLRSDELRNSYESPSTDQHLVSHQATASSGTSDRRLKRSRTINTSSLISLSNYNGSERKAKRTKSMKDIEELTQVTTPDRSKYSAGKGPWELPGSSNSETPKITGASIILKNHKRLRRSFTTMDGVGENIDYQSELVVAPERLEDNQTSSQISSPVDHEMPLSAIMLKKIRRAVSARAIEPEDSPSTTNGSIQKDLPKTARDVPCIGITEPAIVQVECSSTSEIHHPDAAPSTIHTSGTTTSSVVVIPATLTEEQKLQYNLVDLTSSCETRHSLSEKPQFIEAGSKCLGGGETISDTTQRPAAQSRIGQTPSAILLSSSPHVPSASRKMKRAQSEIGLRESTPPEIIESSSKIKKRRGRRKTTALEEVLEQGASVDELSLVPTQTASAVFSQIIALMKDENRAAEEVSRQGTIGDEHLSRDELQEGEPGNLGKDVPRGIDIRNRTHRNEALDNGGHGRRDLTVSETLAENDVLPTLQIVPTQPKKRGRKKTSEMAASKIKEISHAPDAESCQSVRSTLSAKPPPILCEADPNVQVPPSNKDLNSAPTSFKSKEIMTTPTKMLPKSTTRTSSLASVTVQSDAPTSEQEAPPQTPTKDRDDATHMATEQHSPLQSGKVPYRVGLSKRRRIAPLLKMIRK